MNKLTPIALACAAGLSLTLLPALTASATAPAAENAQLQNDRFNKCLDASNDGSGDVRRPVIIWDCHAGDNQKWVLSADGVIINLSQPNTCLDVPGETKGENGTPLMMYPCHGGDNQKWIQVGNDQFVSAKYPTKCLDASAVNNGANGSPAILWDCHGNGNQRWIKNPF